MRRGSNNPGRRCDERGSSIAGGAASGTDTSVAGGVVSSIASCRQATKACSRLPLPRAAPILAGVSLIRTLPACISEIRSQRSASFMKWVEINIVTPSLRERSDRICHSRSRAIGSTPEVGSSRMRMSGAWIIATASDSRWRTPRGNASGKASMIPPRSNRATISCTRLSIVSAESWNRRACSSRFCRTVSSAYKENACDM